MNLEPSVPSRNGSHSPTHLGTPTGIENLKFVILSAQTEKGGKKKKPRKALRDFSIQTCNAERFSMPHHYAILLFASSARVLNPSASFTAISASIFLLMSTSANFRPYINLL